MKHSIPLNIGDFTPFPAKSLTHRGVVFSRSTLIRAEQKALIKTRLFRQPGSTKGRRYILLESLDRYLEKCLVDVPMSAKEAA